MFSNLLSSRAILAGLVFFVVIVAGSLIYTWNVERDIKAETMRTKKSIQQIETNQGKRITQSMEQTNTTQNEASVKIQETETKVSSTGRDHTEKRIGDALENTLEETEIAELLEKIGAEEEKAEEALSAEERQKQETEKRIREIYQEIAEIVEAAGGKIDATTHPEEIRQVEALQQELITFLKEVSGPDPTLDALSAMNTFGQRFQNSVNSNGEMPVSEALLMADFLETQLSDKRGAKALRLLAEVALHSGSDIIKAEHYEAGYKAEQEASEK